MLSPVQSAEVTDPGAHPYMNTTVTYNSSHRSTVKSHAVQFSRHSLHTWAADSADHAALGAYMLVADANPSLAVAFAQLWGPAAQCRAFEAVE